MPLCWVLAGICCTCIMLYAMHRKVHTRPPPVSWCTQRRWNGDAGQCAGQLQCNCPAHDSHNDNDIVSGQCNAQGLLSSRKYAFAQIIDSHDVSRTSMDRHSRTSTLVSRGLPEMPRRRRGGLSPRQTLAARSTDTSESAAPHGCQVRTRASTGRTMPRATALEPRRQKRVPIPRMPCLATVAP